MTCFLSNLKNIKIDGLTSVFVHACVLFFLLDQQSPRKKWCNIPAIHQTRQSTCGLTLSLQLLKYVVSNYWNMHATSVPRNTFSLAFSHPASNQGYYSTSRFEGLTMQSHQTVRGIGTMSGEQKHLSLCCSLFLVSPSIWKQEEMWDMDLEGSTGVLFVCWASPVIDRLLPLSLANAQRQGLQPESKYVE